MSKTNIVLAVDPGIMNGICAWNIDKETPELIVDLFTHVHINDMTDFLADVIKDYEVKFFVVEDFQLFGKLAKQQSGSSMPASRVIGQMELIAKMADAPLYKQKANLLPQALKIAGVEMPKDHSKSHRFSAYAHGYLKMHELKMVKSALRLELEKKNGKNS